MKAKTWLAVVHLDPMSGNAVHESCIFCGHFGSVPPNGAFFGPSTLNPDSTDHLRPGHFASEEAYAQRVEKTKFGRLNNLRGQVGIF
jgi:hypothetical protein